MIIDELVTNENNKKKIEEELCELLNNKIESIRSKFVFSIFHNRNIPAQCLHKQKCHYNRNVIQITWSIYIIEKCR